jgi:peptidoglycan/LPS O-acetylase OafA/YrhL
MIIQKFRVRGGITWYGRTLWIVAGMAVSILLVKNYQQNVVLMLVVALLMISVCWQLAKIIGENRAMAWLSKHNFTMYLYSWPFQAAVMTVCTMEGFSWWLTTICMFITGLIAPSIMIYIYEHGKRIQNRFFELVLGIK